MASWTEDEFEEIDFNDERLSSRFSELVGKLGSNAGRSIQVACEDWANTKAAYRFFSNPKISAEIICGAHAKSTAQRVDAVLAGSKSFVLAVQDTTFINYSYQPRTQGLGDFFNFKRNSGEQVKTVGFILHSSLALSEDGVPLGLFDQKLWTRTKGKIGNIIKCGKNMTRIPIEEKESFRCIEAVRHVSNIVNDRSRIIHVGDRESDIFEFFHEPVSRIQISWCESAIINAA
jgi:hypothetical protein